MNPGSRRQLRVSKGSVLLGSVLALFAGGGCGDGDTSTEAAEDSSPQAVAVKFVDGMVVANPEACALLTDKGAVQVATVTETDNCASGLVDPAAMRLVFGVGNGAALQTAAVAAQVDTGDNEATVTLDLGDGRSASIKLVKDGSAWHVDLVRRSASETITAGG